VKPKTKNTHKRTERKSTHKTEVKPRASRESAYPATRDFFFWYSY